jgi:hypothetical protein
MPNPKQMDEELRETLRGGEFSVWQWLGPEELQERVREFVSAEEAMNAFMHYTNNVAVKMGVTQRVIITDGGDFTAAEWKKGEGYTFPPELVAEAKKRGVQK